MTSSSPHLFVVATPIGNLEDLSPRALACLKKVDIILAEDTRHSARLLQHFGIHNPLQSYHEHNEAEKTQEVLTAIQNGQCFALISDAGTPAFSDPGARLVNALLKAGYTVSPIPGPSAAITALSASGLESAPFHFYGFLPATSSQKRKFLLDLKKTTSGTLCFYESPHRILDTLSALTEIWGSQHNIVMAKELSKIYESIQKCSLEALSSWFEEDSKRTQGEFVLLIENTLPTQDADTALSVSLTLLLETLLRHLSLKEAVSEAVLLSGLSKNGVYERALKINQNHRPP